MYNLIILHFYVIRSLRRK